MIPNWGVILYILVKKNKKTNPENVRRTFQNFRRFCRTLPVLLRRLGPLLRRTFAPIAFLLFFHVNLSVFELLRTLPRGSQKHGPQSSQRTSQKSEKFSELLGSFSGFSGSTARRAVLPLNPLYQMPAGFPWSLQGKEYEELKARCRKHFLFS